MANLINSRTFSGIVDQRIVMSNSQFARQWTTSIGTNWTTLRAGIRFSITDSGANVTSTPKFYFGLCSGTTNLIQDTTTTNFIGLTSNGATWTRNAATGYMLGNGSYFDTGFSAMTKIGTITATSAFTNSPFPGATYIFNAASASRCCLFLDITKGNPNYTIFPSAYFKTSTPTDVSVTTYTTQIAVTTPTITGHQYGNESKTLAFSETSGSLDCVTAAWDRTSPVIEISDLAVVKLA